MPRASRSRRSTNETTLPSPKTRRSRDEDRRARVNRPPFATDGLSRLRARAPPEVRLPFTRFGYRPGFRPIGYRSRASLSPRAFCRLLQYDDARAPPRAASIPRAAIGGDLPPNTFALVLTSSRERGGKHGLTSRAVVLAKTREALPRDRADASKGSPRFSAGESPSRTGSAHLFVVRAVLREAESSRASCVHPGSSTCANAR
jgi:hypothetical protein